MYVPTLGPLARDLTQISRYQVAAEAFRNAGRLAEQGKTDQAAGMYRVARHTADVFAAALDTRSPRLARAWRGTVRAVDEHARRHSVAL